MTSKYRSSLILLTVLCAIACEEHIRDNPMDAGSDCFMPPPPANIYIYDVEYQPVTGRVISIGIAIWFNDSLPQDYRFYHTMSLNDTIVWNEPFVIDAATQVYGFRFYYGPAIEWPGGEYCFCAYWGDIGVGACPFIIDTTCIIRNFGKDADLRIKSGDPGVAIYMIGDIHIEPHSSDRVSAWE